MYIGNTPYLYIAIKIAAVYPCVYREHVERQKSRCPLARFIPVYTGNTLDDTKWSVEDAVYPCVYREHAGEFKARDGRPGLSLCIQGTLTVTNSPRRLLRFIPVYTGNTSWSPDENLEYTVYPCVYREHGELQLNHGFFCGLSLCIQGTQMTEGTTWAEHRFIPVYTGNTLSIVTSLSNVTVYPCVYREHWVMAPQNRMRLGLSLCVQGTQIFTKRLCNAERFIPVCTGNTICSIFVWL